MDRLFSQKTEWFNILYYLLVLFLMYSAMGRCFNITEFFRIRLMYKVNVDELDIGNQFINKIATQRKSQQSGNESGLLWFQNRYSDSPQ